jgi:superfamily I DNA/RNA helicase
MKFDKEKLLAIEHTGSPLLVTAGPGSGKTRLEKRMKHCLGSHLFFLHHFFYYIKKSGSRW